MSRFFGLAVSWRVGCGRVELSPSSRPGPERVPIIRCRFEGRALSDWTVSSSAESPLTEEEEEELWNPERGREEEGWADLGAGGV